MAMATMIAGPNGSGKSTLTAKLVEQGFDFGDYLNADDIAKGLTGSPADTAARAQAEVRSQRDAAVATGRSYAFETVMSHPSHVKHLQEARRAGFTTRLIFVATEDPSINHLRVATRVAHGGHDVPADRIAARYQRCLANLPDAIRAADVAMVFDNSRPGHPFRFLAEITAGNLRHVEIRRSGHGKIDVLDLPYWWLAVLAGFASAVISRDGPIV